MKWIQKMEQWKVRRKIHVQLYHLPKLTHTCSDCGEFFVGTGYEPNALEDMMSDEELIICEDCAMEQHALSLAMGKSLDEFKRDF